jgi:CheY-like chemotaxis protein
MNGVCCKEVNDGESGLFEIQRKYDLIILDIAIPEYMVLDIISQLKKQGVHNLNIIILTTTMLKSEDFEIYKELGQFKVLNKPITLAQLSGTIKDFVYHINILN